jgi:hypothetical protein
LCNCEAMGDSSGGGLPEPKGDRSRAERAISLPIPRVFPLTLNHSGRIPPSRRWPQSSVLLPAQRSSLCGAHANEWPLRKGIWLSRTCANPICSLVRHIRGNGSRKRVLRSADPSFLSPHQRIVRLCSCFRQRDLEYRPSAQTATSGGAFQSV